MRDVIGRMRLGMMGGGYAGRTTSPKSARPGCRFLVPPRLQKLGDRNGKRSTSQKKRMLILYLTC